MVFIEAASFVGRLFFGLENGDFGYEELYKPLLNRIIPYSDCGYGIKNYEKTKTAHFYRNSPIVL